MANLTPPTSLLGHVTDDWQYTALLSDALEHVSDMLWPNNIPVLARMSKDPQVGAAFRSYTQPIRRASWSVDPAGVRPEVAQLVADDLGLPVAGLEKQTAARVRGVSFRDYLASSLDSLLYGHACFELLAKLNDTTGQARLVALAERMQASIANIHVDQTGAFAGIDQTVSRGADDGPQIPADRLVWHVHERRGDNWQGTSLARNSWAPWLLKMEMQKVLATSNRRFGMGVPAVEWDSGANPTPQQMSEAMNMASAARAGDTAGLTTPPGAHLVLKGLSGSTPDTLAFLNWLDQQISKSMLAQWLDLGSTPNGSRALGESFVDFFIMSLQTIADDIADVTTRQVAARIVEWNYGDDEPVPAVKVADVGSRREVTVEAIQALLSSKAITADPTIETWVRREWGLPAQEKAVEVPAKAKQFDWGGIADLPDGEEATATDGSAPATPKTTAPVGNAVQAAAGDTASDDPDQAFDDRMDDLDWGLFGSSDDAPTDGVMASAKDSTDTYGKFDWAAAETGLVAQDDVPAENDGTIPLHGGYGNFDWGAFTPADENSEGEISEELAKVMAAAEASIVAEANDEPDSEPSDETDDDGLAARMDDVDWGLFG